MAVDKRGRKLPKGIQQRYDGYEASPMIKGKRYLVHGKTIAEVQQEVAELKYKLAHGLFVEKKKVTFGEWFDTWIQEYKKRRVKTGTLVSYQKYYNGCIKQRFVTTYITISVGNIFRNCIMIWQEKIMLYQVLKLYLQY